MTDAERLRELAAWYREFAEKTENPWIWAARVVKAEALEAEAKRAEHDGKVEADRNRGSSASEWREA